MTRLSYALRKHPSVRLAALALLIVAGVFLLSFFTRNIMRKPTIESISPKVGTPGDVLVIRGKSFGENRGSSYVEISGNRVTESGYISWQNDEIRILIPTNVEDGLIYVVTRGGKSNPDFFANELAIPVYMPQNPLLSTPTISEVSPENPYTGQVIVITGTNFGSARENSTVYFSCRDLEDSSSENTIDTSATGSNKQTYTPFASSVECFTKPVEEEFDYEYWSETEIRVRVPDGAQTGSIFVATDNGRSSMQPLTVRRRCGEKTFKTKHTYLIQVESSITGINGNKNATITLHMPHPAAFSQQTQVNLTETKPEPTLLNYRGTSIFQVTLDDEAKTNFNAKQNFVVECSSAETIIYRDYVHAFNEKNRLLYRTYTNADEVIPADTDELLALLPNVIFQVTNPYRRAELIFDYMVQNYKISDKTRAQTADPLDLVKKKRGDAYDFAVIYTALLRTAGIPARMLSGVLVNADKRTQNHWWTEFYLEDFGWVPVDVALGAGMKFEPFLNERHSPRYYFGNIDAQHVAFSLNYSVVKQSMLNNKIVYMPRSYALQSVWEESSNDIEGYSSYWATPVVLGIY